MLPLKDSDPYLKKKKKKAFRVLIIYLLNLDGIEDESSRSGPPTF